MNCGLVVLRFRTDVADIYMYTYIYIYIYICIYICIYVYIHTHRVVMEETVNETEQRNTKLTLLKSYDANWDEHVAHCG